MSNTHPSHKTNHVLRDLGQDINGDMVYSLEYEIRFKEGTRVAMVKKVTDKTRRVVLGKFQLLAGIIIRAHHREF